MTTSNVQNQGSSAMQAYAAYLDKSTQSQAPAPVNPEVDPAEYEPLMQQLNEVIGHGSNPTFESADAKALEGASLTLYNKLIALDRDQLVPQQLEFVHTYEDAFGTLDQASIASSPMLTALQRHLELSNATSSLLSLGTDAASQEANAQTLQSYASLAQEIMAKDPSSLTQDESAFLSTYFMQLSAVDGETLNAPEFQKLTSLMPLISAFMGKLCDQYKDLFELVLRTPESQRNQDMVAFFEAYVMLQDLLRKGMMNFMNLQADQQVAALQAAAKMTAEAGKMRMIAGITQSSAGIAGGVAQVGMAAQSHMTSSAGNQSEVRANDAKTQALDALNQPGAGAAAQIEHDTLMGVSETHNMTAKGFHNDATRQTAWGRASGDIFSSSGGVAAGVLGGEESRINSDSQLKNAEATGEDQTYRFAQDASSKHAEMASSTAQTLQAINEARMQSNKNVAHNMG